MKSNPVIDKLIYTIFQILTGGLYRLYILYNFSTKYLVMCKIHTDVCGNHVCPPVCKIIHSLKLVDNLNVQTDNSWYNYYLSSLICYNETQTNIILEKRKELRALRGFLAPLLG